MDRSTKKLLNGSMVYFVGNALTQLISLFLMRFVTGNITPEEYGFFNLVTTVSNLAIPFVTLQIADAVFKFVLKAKDEEEKKSYFTTCFIISFISVGIIIGAVFILSCIVNVPNTFLVAIYVASYALFGIYQKIIRCLNRNTVFVVGNLIKTVLFLVLEILLISTLHMGIEALLIAHIASLIFFLIYAEVRVKALKYFDIRRLRAPIFKSMMSFSIPLIPNAAFWWLTSSVNHVIVSAKLGVAVNGIYSVAGKFSSVLAMVTSVLNMSWQDTAIADYGSKDFKEFFTKTFNTFVKLVFSAIAVIIPLISLIIPYMIDPVYYDSIPYTPFLLLVSGTSALSGFVAQIFTGKGETKKIFVTSLLGMIANIAIILTLIDHIGLWAAVMGSLAADAVLVGTRIYMARKEFAKGIDYKSFALIALITIVSVLLYLRGETIANLVWFVISGVVAIVLNLEFIKNIFSLLFGRFLNKRKGDANE